MKLRGWWSSLLVVGACDQGKRDEKPREPGLAASTYACREQRPEPPKPTALPIENNTIVLGAKACVPGGSAGGGLGGLGSWSIQVRSRDGATCVVELMDEIEGGYTVRLCKVALPARIPLVPDQVPAVSGCTVLRTGNLLMEQGSGSYDTQLNIPGTNFVVHESSEPGGIPLTPDPNSPHVTLGAAVRIKYQLYDDRAYTVASTLPGASGELVYRHGAGEVGQAIERVFSTNSSGTARVARAMFRAEVAHGIREKLPAVAPDALFCADLALVKVTAPAAPLQGATPCPSGEQYFCQLGPTSVDNTTSARGCGCGVELCPNHGFRWTTDTGEKWPDGSSKLMYECVDDKERIRRTQAARSK